MVRGKLTHADFAETPLTALVLLIGQVVVTWPHMVTREPGKRGLSYWAVPGNVGVHLVKPKARMEMGGHQLSLLYRQLSLVGRVSL